MHLTTIKINNAKFYGYHGDLDHEKKYGNQFEVDICMECDLTNLNHKDKLNYTVDYLAVYNLVSDIFSKEKYNLIESLNLKICTEVLNKFELVKKIFVSVRKPNASLGIIDSVEVSNTMEK